MRDSTLSPALRFHYPSSIGIRPSLQVERYHQQLAGAEMLLARVQAASTTVGKAIHTRLTANIVALAVQRPSREEHTPGSPEYLRWYEPNGDARARPLHREALTEVLMAVQHVPMMVATHLAQHWSSAISADEVAWLNDRAHAPSASRPLDASEYEQLTGMIEDIYRGAIAAPESSAMRKNAQTALSAARFLGEMHDDYVRSPFQQDMLSAAYQRAHADHLHAVAVGARSYEDALREKVRLPDADPVEQAKRVRKMAEFAATLAERAVEGVEPKPMALSVRLETSDGREIWWSVMAVDPDGVSNSAVCEAIVDSDAYDEHPDAGAGETVGFVVEVHYDDGTTPAVFEGTGDMWRDIEMGDGETEFYRRLLEGASLEDAAQIELNAPRSAMG